MIVFNFMDLVGIGIIVVFLVAVGILRAYKYFIIKQIIDRLTKKLAELNNFHDWLFSYDGLFKCSISDGRWAFLVKKNEREIAEVKRKLDFWKGQK